MERIHLVQTLLLDHLQDADAFADFQQDWITLEADELAAASLVEGLDVHPGTARLLIWSVVVLEALRDQQARIRDALEHGDSSGIKNLLAHLAYGVDLDLPRKRWSKLRPFKSRFQLRDRRAPWAPRRAEPPSEEEFDRSTRRKEK